MKRIYILILTVASSAIFFSCVSAGKYDEMVALKDSIQTSADSLEKVIYQNNLTIDELNYKLKELRTNKSNLETELASLKENYEKMKSTSSDKTKELLNTIETLQKDLAVQNQKMKEIDEKLKAREGKINALREKLSQALLGFADKGLSVSIKNGKVYVSLSNQLLFQSGKTDIDKKGQEALLELANVLNTQPEINILVEGHTDDVQIRSHARFKDNWDLSVLRATEVVRYLTVDGQVDPKRVIASGRSEFFPIQTGDSDEDRASNRRTEIILTPKLDELFEMIDG